ncbi:iron transporter (plasmid) [Halorussus salilacus]|uniref:iron transporter n=1 Tax=Halorussus salilacus TaxID=2953750 RepID=UPI00209DA1A3|nr:iron transporter [Halorussus salilacus]USZ69813.1 iron transporter [Halorussus salilacus]
MNRRHFLRAGTAVGASGMASLAGCAGLFESESTATDSETATESVDSSESTDSDRREEVTTVEDRDEQVYHPTHREGAAMVGTGGEGRYRVALLYSVAHAFWTITGTDTNLVEVGDDATVHLMATVWDGETETVLPTANVSAEISRDGERVDSRDFWPMLSQNMGYHFGDNVSLDGDGTYTATLDVGAMQARGLGELAGAFDERTTLEVEFDHERAVVGDLAYERFPDEEGEAGALEPMEMDVPVSRVPERDALPGSVVALDASGDADFPVFLPDETPAGVDGEYLAVSPRTPYNRYPLPFTGLSATVRRGGETVFDGALDPAVSPEYGYHYGAAVPGVESGDSLTLTVETPPQISRHEGYETAFVEMPTMELTV